MQYIFLVIGIIIILLVKYYEQKINAKKTFSDFEAFINKVQEEVLEQIFQNKHVPLEIYEIVPQKSNIYLLSNEKETIKAEALNNNKEKKISERQYQKLINKMQCHSTICDYNIDMSSIYYRPNEPYQDYILWIYFSSHDAHIISK